MNQSLYSPEQQALLDEATLRIKRELLLPIITGAPYASKVIPLNVQNFGELHDYCDANCLGGFCDDGPDSMHERFCRAFPTRTDDQTLATQGAMNAMNNVQTFISDWISEGGLARDAASCARMNREQLECFFDDERAAEAYGMVMDLDARCQLWTHGGEEVERICALLVTTSHELPDEYSELMEACSTAENFADEGNAVVVLQVATEDRRPAYVVKVFEGIKAEEQARAIHAHEGLELWVDGVPVAS